MGRLIAVSSGRVNKKTTPKISNRHVVKQEVVLEEDTFAGLEDLDATTGVNFSNEDFFPLT